MQRKKKSQGYDFYVIFYVGWSDCSRNLCNCEGIGYVFDHAFFFFLVLISAIYYYYYYYHLLFMLTRI